jgi:hypothetical protein
MKPLAQAPCGSRTAEERARSREWQPIVTGNYRISPEECGYEVQNQGNERGCMSMIVYLSAELYSIPVFLTANTYGDVQV